MFIQIIRHDDVREDSVKRSKQKQFEERLSRAIGARWIIEAFVGPNGDISGINQRSCVSRDVDGNAVWFDPEKVRREFEQLQKSFREKPVILVGHNLFTDLICFYQMFLGPLPETVEDFGRVINCLFPV